MSKIIEYVKEKGDAGASEQDIISGIRKDYLGAAQPGTRLYLSLVNEWAMAGHFETVTELHDLRDRGQLRCENERYYSVVSTLPA